MKKIMIIAVAILTSITFVTAQKQGVKKEAKPVSALEWVQPDANLGKVPYRVPATATYEFVNKGDKPVIITNVRTTCGCTSRQYSKEPIKPGEKSQIQATYNAARLGNFTKSVIVTTNEPGVSPKVLKIRGVVVQQKEEAKKKVVKG